MKIYFFGVPASSKNLNDIFTKYYKGVPQVRPQQNFDFSLVEGLSQYCEVDALSIPSVESYPRSSCLFYRGNKEEINNNTSISYVSMLNISLIKNIFLLFYVLKWCIKIVFDKTGSKQKTIMIANVNFLTVFPLFIISRIFKIKLISIMADLPHFTVGYTKNFKTMIRKNTNSLTKLMCSKFDGYILLSKYMDDIVNKKRKPYLVIEGILYDIEDKDTEKVNELLTTYENINYLMYAGTLHKKFGIERLVKNFLAIDNLNSDIELWIFGQGDYQEELIKIANSHKKIRFFGTMSRENIYQFEKNSFILLNPRPSDEEFTKYSFPSKTIEYMSSGRPVLTTHLKGIPDEYDDYLYYIDDSTDDSFMNSIKKVIEKDNKELTERGSISKKFVFDKKNKYYQAKKIVTFVREKV